MLAGIRAQICIAPDLNDNHWGHAFIRVESYVVDVTATQFRFPAVCVRTFYEQKLPGFWRPHTKLNDPVSFAAALRQRGWNALLGSQRMETQ